jgi:CheY-like chemotaxis protein
VASYPREDVARTALVVDDEPLILDLIADMLGDLGCEVITAAEGAEALSKLKGDDRIDLLITDISMPGLNGYEVAEAAKRVRPGLHIILVSGRDTEGHGFPLLRKPFMQEDLARVMSRTTGLC